MNQVKRTKPLQNVTVSAKIKVRIYTYNTVSHSRNVSVVRMYFSPETMSLIGFDEIVFDKRKMFIKRPSIDSLKTLKIHKHGHVSLSIKDEDLVGE